ncbi:uncharacterized protein J7T54_007978 [Emericellopsis cladophorae]|uniref:Probable alpha/beta-glucosidase agdC n=1 Tax=Emericellopsis cladophorae TaxID=2686198 RepID=A0A9P9Y7D8_9HYPO|nr:uncharacterized protein J7T54_007978 [Emericellopsis cladophorae]KAI6784884.1 hypothetical protein J7T54_007978 [Emericellopsis cladophorae]
MDVGKKPAGRLSWAFKGTLVAFVITQVALVAVLATWNGVARVDSGICGGYQASNVIESDFGVQADLDLIADNCSIYGADVPSLRFIAEYQSDKRLHVLIQDRDGERYQVPEDIIPRPGFSTGLTKKPDLKFDFTKAPFSFTVSRRSTEEILFSTKNTSLVFERQYLRLQTWLPSQPNLYGLGAIPKGHNLYGSHPIYVDHRLTGTHGVFLLNSNGMDIKLNQDQNGDQYMEYNIIGGVLDFYFFAGPGPEDVARQYAEVVGVPAMVPYWSLGYHQCKYGYRDWFEVAEVVHNYSVANIPLETMWTDINYMDHRRVFSLDPGNYPIERMQDLIEYLHERDQHYTLMVDPAVAEHDYPAYNRGKGMDVFVKRRDGQEPFRGVVWPGVAVFPDWFHENATEYWSDMFHDSFNPETGVDIDGVWIDMNEPASFCRQGCNPDREAKNRNLPPKPPAVREPPRSIPGLPFNTSREVVVTKVTEQETLRELASRGLDSKKHFDVDHAADDLLSPPYSINNKAPGGKLSDMTMDTDLTLANGLTTYDTHNLYGALMSMTTRAAMLARRPNLRPFVITRSTFAGTGHYVQKWLGDNVSRWSFYRIQIAQMLSFASIFQIPMVGSDVCGFGESTNEKLCARWATLGAFNPFYRNHATESAAHQEFYLWPLVTSAAQYAIDVRYRLLDYIYTALEFQSRDGTPAVLKPMWHVYPQDEETFGIDLQFFYGDCVLVSPVTQEGSTDVDMYMPKGALFYEWDSRAPVRGNGWTTIKDVAFDRIPLHIRGGCILPLRSESAHTTTELRKQPFELLVALGSDGAASGRLYVDDGVSLDGGEGRAEVEFQHVGGKLNTTATRASGEQVALEDIGVDIAGVVVLRQGEEPGDEL